MRSVRAGSCPLCRFKTIQYYVVRSSFHRVYCKRVHDATQKPAQSIIIYCYTTFYEPIPPDAKKLTAIRLIFPSRMKRDLLTFEHPLLMHHGHSVALWVFIQLHHGYSFSCIMGIQLHHGYSVASWAFSCIMGIQLHHGNNGRRACMPINQVCLIAK